MVSGRVDRDGGWGRQFIVQRDQSGRGEVAVVVIGRAGGERACGAGGGLCAVGRPGGDGVAFRCRALYGDRDAVLCRALVGVVRVVGAGCGECHMYQDAAAG